MAHYAFLDEQNIVTHVIVGRDETEGDFETYYSQLHGQKCVRTSYNHNIRKQFAGIGYTYEPTADVFIAPQPFPSWSLDENHDWQAPIPQPEGAYVWDEDTLTWVAVEEPS